MSEPAFTIAMMALRQVDGFGERKMFDLAPRVLSMKDEGEISPESLIELVNEGTISPRCEVSEIRTWLDEANSRCNEWGREGIQVTTAYSPNYPSQLLDISTPPFFLYYKGDIAPLSKTNVAIVGTREPSVVGRRQAKTIARELVGRDIGVVSGLALGCDTAGHEGALEGGGYTCAVLAHGLDIVTPTRNSALADNILEKGGALVSEHASGVPPTRRYYAMRNRIQSALSTHVIVIETTLNGGTMHTARFARDQGRVLGVLEIPQDQSAQEFQPAVEEIKTNLGGAVLQNMQGIFQFLSIVSEEE